MMADLDERNYTDESAAPESRPASARNGAGGKKKKKNRGCGFLLLLMLLATGAAAGFHVSGAVDLRPYVYPVVPMIPYVGETLADMLDIPEIYTMTADERRRLELEEWENRIAETVRSIDERERNLNLLSAELDELERILDAEREVLAAREEALNEDIEAGGMDPGGPQGGTGDDAADIQDTIRTYQDMSPRRAASILERLDEDLAVTILDGMPLDTRGILLGRMDADIAARLTEQLSDLQRRRARQQSNQGDAEEE